MAIDSIQATSSWSPLLAVITLRRPYFR